MMLSNGAYPPYIHVYRLYARVKNVMPRDRGRAVVRVLVTCRGDYPRGPKLARTAHDQNRSFIF